MSSLLAGLRQFPHSTQVPVLYESHALQQIGLAHQQAGHPGQSG